MRGAHFFRNKSVRRQEKSARRAGNCSSTRKPEIIVCLLEHVTCLYYHKNCRQNQQYFLVGRTSPYVHSRQPKTLYLNPTLTLVLQSDLKPNPKPYPNHNQLTILPNPKPNFKRNRKI